MGVSSGRKCPTRRPNWAVNEPHWEKRHRKELEFKLNEGIHPRIAGRGFDDMAEEYSDWIVEGCSDDSERSTGSDRMGRAQINAILSMSSLHSQSPTQDLRGQTEKLVASSKNATGNESG